MSNASAFAISPSNAPGSFNPTLTALPCTLANTEYSYPLPAGTGTFFLQARDGGAIKFSYAPGGSGTDDSIKIGANGFYSREAILNTASYTLYFQSPIAGTLLVVETWKT